MPSMDSVVTGLGNVRTHTRKVAEEIADRWTLYFIWGIGASGEHAEGRALDFMGMEFGGGVNRPGRMRRKVCDQIADYLWTNRKRLGVWYVIWDRRIISMTYESQGWRPYTGSNPHADHVHVSFYNGVAYKPPTGKEDDDVSAKDVWTYQTKNIRLTDDMQRVEQSEWNMATFIRDIEATTDLTRRKVDALAGDMEKIADRVWNYQVQNADATGPGGGMAPVRWHIKDLERTQDSQGKQLDRIEAGMRALAAGLGETTANAVNAALAVHDEGDEKR